jgi:hypothetical protein
LIGAEPKQVHFDGQSLLPTVSAPSGYEQPAPDLLAPTGADAGGEGAAAPAAADEGSAAPASASDDPTATESDTKT